MAATVPHRSSRFTIGPLELETTAGDSQDDSEDTTGRAAWTAGCKLAELLLLEDKHSVREWFPPGARVLELGAGCGVAVGELRARAHPVEKRPAMGQREPFGEVRHVVVLG